MKRVLFLAAMLLGGSQMAMANGYTVLSGPMPLIAPIGQPRAGNSGFTPAPVPNQDIVAPRSGRAPVPGEPEFVASLTATAPAAHDGAGYSQGSRFSESLQRGNRSAFGAGLAPSFGFKVPLEK